MLHRKKQDSDKTAEQRGVQPQASSDIMAIRHGMYVTCCFCVDFGAVGAGHFTCYKCFSAFLPVQSGFKQHCASQWDGAVDKTSVLSQSKLTIDDDSHNLAKLL